MATGIFRRPWMYSQLRLRYKIGLAPLNNTTLITGQAATTAFTTVAKTIDSTMSGVAASASVGSPTPTLLIALPGVAAVAAVGTITLNKELGVLTGQVGTSAAGAFGVPISSTVSLTNNQVTASSGSLSGDHPLVAISGVSASAAVGVITETRPIRMMSQFVTAQLNGDVFNVLKNISLTGLYVTSSPDAHTVYFPAGGGGGGAAGLFGDGQDGGDGSAFGIGGYGGAADNFNVPAQLTPGAQGNAGIEFNGVIGDGSGGGGGSWSSNIGQDGGLGGIYGGGGGGGGGGINGGGQGGLGYQGVVYISYISSVTSDLVEIIFEDSSASPWVVPADWSPTNKIILVGPGGCGEDASATSAGNGGDGGDTVGVENTLVFNPGDIIPYHVETLTSCTQVSTTFASYSAAGGGNGDGGGGGGSASAGFAGGFMYTGGLGGPKGLLSTLGLSPVITLPTPPPAVAQISLPLSTAPGPRTFLIAGIDQTTIAAGLVMLPTSEDVVLGPSDYVIGSSQYYEIGEVHWNGVARIQGTDWEFVDPFKHIIHILVSHGSISTPVRFIYYAWDIGARTGFRVTSNPIPFAFVGTRILAERVPQPNQFLTVNYTTARRGLNPTTMFARYPTIIDDILPDHLLYDGDSGFESYRPSGYRVFNTDTNLIYTWDGSQWNSSGTFTNGDKFYVKRQRAVYQIDGTDATVIYTAGDPLTLSVPEALTYPVTPIETELFGESIGKNFLQDAFSANASVDFPSAYVISQRPGNYDDWIADEFG